MTQMPENADNVEKLRTSSDAIAASKLLEAFMNDDEAVRRQMIAEYTQRTQQLGANRDALKREEQKLYDQRVQLDIFSASEKQSIDSQITGLSERRASIETQISDIEEQISTIQSRAFKMEAVRWKMLSTDEDNNRALFITWDCVARMPYHQSGGSITWEACTLREWLNTVFYHNLPLPIRSRVLELENQNLDNSTYKTPGGNPTRDKVFLLSIDEAGGYFKSDSERVAEFEGAGDCWWLRSPGGLADIAAYVGIDGFVHAYGNLVDDEDYYGVRPAIWLSLEG